MEGDASGVTRLLAELREGDEAALAELVTRVQVELRGLAAQHLRGERADHTLQPTALVNEAYLRLVGQRERNWQAKGHFLAIASTAMRRVLLEHARARLAAKRGGGAERVTLFEVESAMDDPPETVVALDDALEHFARIDPEGARIVELRWFGGLEVGEVASLLEVSTRTVERAWRVARAWLRERLASS